MWNWITVYSFKFTALSLLCLCFCISGKAQDSAFAYPADLDSATVDSFYQTKTIDLRKCDNPALYFEVFRWMNTRYCYGGNSEKGIDCSHFVNTIYQKIYGDTLNSSSASIYTQCKPKKGGLEEAVEGDLIFFRIQKKRISHVGVYLQHGKFAHASTQSGVIISDINEAYYKRYFYKIARFE